MFQLIKNEHKKFISQKMTIIALGLIAMYQLVVAIIVSDFTSYQDTPDTFVDYFATSTHVMFVLQVLAIVVGATLISTEFQKGTIKFLLIRPKTRLHIFLSKYVTLVLIVTYSFIVYYALSFLFGFIFFDTQLYSNDSRLLQQTFAVVGCQWLEVVMMASFAFMCSSLFRNSVFALVTSFVVLYTAKFWVAFMNIFPIFEGGLWKYLLFVNTKFTQYSFQGPPLFDGMSPLFSVFIVGAHFVFFVGTAWLSFWKRDVNV
ncbi:ABC transporter permease [Bacillus sp. 179-C3.3 HS]|uniref:ABC transporter permease n=1 Tax=Bacillus sp. 179-C3.3 HS TaxID=3232162 RepID=UPI0039A22098